MRKKGRSRKNSTNKVIFQMKSISNPPNENTTDIVSAPSSTIATKKTGHLFEIVLSICCGCAGGWSRVLS